MDGFAYQHSPKIDDLKSTYPTESASPRLKSTCSICNHSSGYQYDNQKYSELKREYVKALNSIEILKLEKNNLESALKLYQNLRKEVHNEGAGATKTTSNSASRNDRGYYSSHSLEIERKINELERDLYETRRKLEACLTENESLKKINYSYQERQKETEQMHLKNYQLRDEIDYMSREIQTLTNQVSRAEDEKAHMLEKLSSPTKSFGRFPPRGLYKYLDYIHDVINSIGGSHFANYYFQECFATTQNIERLIESEDTNQLILQAFKYISHLLISLTSSNSYNGKPDTQRVLFTDSGVENHRNDEDSVIQVVQNYSTENSPAYSRFQPEEVPSASLQNHSMLPQTIRLNHSASPINRDHTLNQSIRPATEHELKAVSNANTPMAQSRSRISNKNSISVNNLKPSPSNSRILSVSKLTTKQNPDLNVSKKHSSMVNSANGNLIGQSYPQLETRQGSIERQTPDLRPANASRTSLAKSYVQEAQGEKRLSNATSEKMRELSEMDKVLHEKEKMLREVDRQLYEKSRLLEARDAEVQETSIDEIVTGGFRGHDDQNVPTNPNLSRLSKKTGDPKSASKLNQSASKLNQSASKINQSASKINQSRDVTNKTKDNINTSKNVSIRKDNTAINEKTVMRENLSGNNSMNRSKIIPTITSINEYDNSPKGAQFQYSRQGTKGGSPIASFTRTDFNNEYSRSQKGQGEPISPIVGFKVPTATSFPDLNEATRTRDFGEQMSPTTTNNFDRSLLKPQPVQHPEGFSNHPAHESYMNDRKMSNSYHVNLRNEGQFNNSQNEADYPGGPFGGQLERRITFDVNNNLEDIQECSPRYDQGSSPDGRSPSRRATTEGKYSPKTKGNEYSSFRVSFGRTQRKDIRGMSPPDTKSNLYIYDVAKRKRVQHNEQTYDVIKGDEIRYNLTPHGPYYGAVIDKPKSKYALPNPIAFDTQSLSSEKTPKMSSAQADF